MMEKLRNTPVKPVVTSYEQLQAQLKGTALLPNDAGYDEARKSWNLNVNQHPAVIVLPENTADVAAAVQYAESADLGIAVQATGHGSSRPADASALLIVTTRMQEVEIDAQAKTAWVAAGVKWEVVLEKAQEVGLAPLLGSSPDVGAVGYTLGGGMGWLARKFGMSADSVNFFEVVTADGEIRRVGKENNSDLFWAVRGGGGSFGVITGMEIQLYPVTTIYAGNLFYPAEQAKEVFLHYREWIKYVPEELTSSILIMNFPPIPAVPEFLRGHSFVMVRGAYCGPVAEGEELMKYWREWQAPIVDDFKAIPFTQVGAVSNDPKEPSVGMSSSMWLKELDDETIDLVIQYGVNVQGSSPLVVIEIRHAGGAIARVQKAANAYGNRDASLILQTIGMAPIPEMEYRLSEYVKEFRRALQAHTTGGTYINFLEGEEKWARTKEAFTPENYRRLMTIKAKYDPQNRFRHSFNIPPVAYATTYVRPEIDVKNNLN